MKKKSKEYKLWEKKSRLQKSEICSLGPHTSYQIKNTPRRILFALARYKFAAKMIGEKKNILELGCGDGFSSFILSEFASSYLGVDFDEDLIEWAKNNLKDKKRDFINENFLGGQYGKFDAVVNFDVLEHIYPKSEKIFMETLFNNLKTDGLAIVGTPNKESSRFSAQHVNAAHINLKDADSLKGLLSSYFSNVFLFSMNDELVHSGYYPLAQYFIGIGLGLRKSRLGKRR